MGEKVSRSLEPLLATPITTNELLWAKSLAAAIPAVTITWLAFAVYVALVLAFTSARVTGHVINFPAVCIIFLMTPLIAGLGLSVGIIASSRFNDPRTAQQAGAIIILRLIGFMLAQIRGIFFLTPAVVVTTAVVLAIADYLIIRLGARSFRRETILTQWR